MSDVIKELKLELWVVHKRDWKFDLKMTLFFIFNFFQQVELVRDRKAVRSWARCSFWTPNCFSILKNYFYHIIIQKIKKNLRVILFPNSIEFFPINFVNLKKWHQRFLVRLFQPVQYIVGRPGSKYALQWLLKNKKITDSSYRRIYQSTTFHQNVTVTNLHHQPSILLNRLIHPNLNQVWES